MVAIPPKPPIKTSHTTTTNTQRQAEHDQHSHLKSTQRWPIQATTGGFATIDPRHAGDTPQRSAYGSNSPQATNENKPHHTNTRATPPQTSATASPTETPPAPPSQTPQHHTETQPRPNRRPLHPKNPMSPAYHRGGLHFEQPRGGFCDHRPPTRRRHAAKQRLW